MRKIPRSGFDVVLRTTIKVSLSSKEKEERGFCNRYVLCVCLSLLSENLIKNVLLIFKNVFSINLGASSSAM